MNILFEYTDGHRDIYDASKNMRGICRNGKRPVVAYVPEELDVETEVTVLMVLHPTTGNIKPLHTPLDKYVELGDKLEPLVKNEATGETMIKKDGITYIYNELLDGTTLDKDSALEKYPEYFV